jgi:hypothetical protein
LPLKEQGRIGEYLHTSTAFPTKIWKDQLDNIPGAETEWYNFLRRNGADDLSFSDPRYLKLADEFTQLINNQARNVAQMAPGADPLPTITPVSEFSKLTDAYNKWILEGPHKKYVTTQFGTGVETDPVLRAVDEANIDPFNLRRERNASSERRSAKSDIEYLIERYESGLQYAQRHPNRPDLFPNPEQTMFYPDINQFRNVGELTARTPAGQKIENAQDYILADYSNTYHPKYSSDDTKIDFPISTKLKIGTPIYDVVAPSLLDDTGLKNIKKHLLDKLVSGEISPEKLPSVSVESIVKDMIKTQQDRLKRAEKDKGFYLDWRSQNHQQLPADVAFTDADGNPTGAKMVVFDADMADANPDLVIRNLSQDTKELNHCVGSYCDRVEEGSSRIFSLRNKISPICRSRSKERIRFLRDPSR